MQPVSRKTQKYQQHFQHLFLTHICRTEVFPENPLSPQVGPGAAGCQILQSVQKIREICLLLDKILTLRHGLHWLTVAMLIKEASVNLIFSSWFHANLCGSLIPETLLSQITYGMKVFEAGVVFRLFWNTGLLAGVLLWVFPDGRMFLCNDNKTNIKSSS